MKNPPAHSVPRSPSAYGRRNKTAYPYPGWVNSKSDPPRKIQIELHRAGGWNDWRDGVLVNRPIKGDSNDVA